MKRACIMAVYATFFVALNWPVLPFMNRIAPRIWHAPFFVGWCMFWSFSIAIFHAVLILAQKRGASSPESASGGKGNQ